MKKSLISIFFGIVFITALAVHADAQMCGNMPGRMMDGMGPGMTMMQSGMGCMGGGGMMMGEHHPAWKHLMSLGLDEKQKEALKGLHSRVMKEMVKKSADKKIAAIELRDLLDKDPVDMKAVEAAVKKGESLRTEMILAHIRAREEMKSLLTPEQRKRLKELMESPPSQGCNMMGNTMEHKDMPMHMHTNEEAPENP